MELIINEKKSGVPDGAHTIGDVIKSVGAQEGAEGRIIVRIALDGNLLAQDKRASVFEESVGSYGEMKLITALPHELCIATIDEVKKHLPSLTAASKDIIDFIAKSDVAKTAEMIGPYFELWGIIIESVSKIAVLMRIDLGEVTTGDVTLSDFCTSLVGLLVDAKSTLAAKDMTGFSDVVEYELMGKIGDLEGLLDSLSRLIETRG